MSRLFLVAITLPAALSVGYAQEDKSNSDTNGCVLTLELIGSDKEKLNAKVIITNHGKSEIKLVAPGDGSLSGWRTPIVGWSILPEDSTNKHPKSIPLVGRLCGNINSLTTKEIVMLKPKESIQLNNWITIPIDLRPGKYRVLFYYSNNPKLKWRGIASHSKEAMKAVRNSTTLNLTSEERIIQIK